MRWTGYLSLALAAVLTAGCNRDGSTAANRDANASPPVGTAGRPADDIGRGDKDFINDLIIANNAEVELGRMVSEKSTDTEVKKFAQMMVDDHTRAGDKLKTIARRYNLPMPELDDKHRDLHQQLSGKQGIELDREYAKAMVDGHEDVLDKLESRVDKERLAEWRAHVADRTSGKKIEERTEAIAVVAEKSDTPVTMSLNEWAAETHPIVYAHLVAARNLDAAMKRRTTN